jgi:DNA-binding transcriptional ArsR family regulator
MNGVLRRSDLKRLRASTGEAAAFLQVLANDKRLLILCELLSAGEVSVTMLADSVGLSQSALSQHLAKLRADGLVDTRRESQTVYYRVARDQRITRTLALLRQLFCT